MSQEKCDSLLSQRKFSYSFLVEHLVCVLVIFVSDIIYTLALTLQWNTLEYKKKRELRKF
jgi:hypothetical protein